jgi:hypothetical protein
MFCRFTVNGIGALIFRLVRLGIDQHYKYAAKESTNKILTMAVEC